MAQTTEPAQEWEDFRSLSSNTLAAYAPAPRLLGGQEVHLSAFANMRYADKAESIFPQNDSVVAVALPGLTQTELAEFADAALKNADAAVHALRARELSRTKTRQSSTTLALLVYNPIAQTVHIRPRGDSLILLAVDDGTHGGAIPLFDPSFDLGPPNPARNGQRPIRNFLGFDPKLGDAPHDTPDGMPPANPGLGGRLADCPEEDLPPMPDDGFLLNDAEHPHLAKPLRFPEDPIRLEPLIKAARRQFSLDPDAKLNVSLVVATDCLSECPEIYMDEDFSHGLADVLSGRGVDNDSVLDFLHVNTLPNADGDTFHWADPNNIAAKIGHALCAKGGQDNQAIVVLPNLHLGSGTPLAVAVADGINVNSALYALVGTDAVASTADRFIKKTKMGPSALVDTEEVQALQPGPTRASS